MWIHCSRKIGNEKDRLFLVAEPDTHIADNYLSKWFLNQHLILMNGQEALPFNTLEIKNHFAMGVQVRNRVEIYSLNTCVCLFLSISYDQKQLW
jgi:hypothetical protein